MSTQIDLYPDLLHYMRQISLRESDLLKRLREETSLHPSAQMQIRPEQGQFMALLVELLGAQRVLELGTFTGYSSLSMALAMGPGGRLDSCDWDPECTAVAQRYWREAGLEGCIQLHLGAALDSLEKLQALGRVYDLAFLDADKENIDLYYERVLAMLRPGGLLLIDNVLWSGRVADPWIQDPATRALRALNQKLYQDERVSLSLLPLGDGLTLARKRAG
jgi:predicted O-methyltransferase YrrM